MKYLVYDNIVAGWFAEAAVNRKLIGTMRKPEISKAHDFGSFVVANKFAKKWSHASVVEVADITTHKA